MKTYAGTGTYGRLGNGGLATNAQLNYVSKVVVDMSGNLFVSDAGNNAIRFINKQTGIIKTIAGKTDGSSGSSGDGAAATRATLNYPYGISLDSSNHFLYIADNFNHKIRLVTLSSGNITTYAGTGAQGSSGDGSLAIYALLNYPSDVACDLGGGGGNVYIADKSNSRIRVVKSNGIITTYAGGGMSYPGDGLKATFATLSSPAGIAIDGHGNLFIADTSSNKIRLVNSTGFITTFAGVGGYNSGLGSDGQLAVDAYLNYPSGVAVDANGNVYIADSMNNAIRFVAHDTGIIMTFAGVGMTGSSGDGSPATSAYLSYPTSVAVDPVSGSVYIADSSNNRVRVVVSSYNFPTSQPSSQPNAHPTSQPSSHPSLPTGQPSKQPTSEPSKYIWRPKQEVGLLY